jgi:hypothetical protein
MNRDHVVVTVAQKWDDIIAQWKASGKTASDWCRENNIDYKAFIYRRSRLQVNNVKAQSIQRSSFVELPNNQSAKAGIEIQVCGLSLLLHKDFDPPTLMRCLQVLVKPC